MRNQTPIQQQRTTQTQLSRGRPHNPSLVRRIQPSGQRTSPLRQMQQQTRQRTRRERKSTPLPEKRGRKRQATRSRHANTTLRHMVNHTPPFQQKKGGKQGEEKRREHNKGNTMVFGDNVRARRAARALPRTPTTKRKRGREEEDKRRDHTPSHTTAIPQHSTTRQHTHHTETHATTHEESTVNSRHHTPFYPTQTATAIPQ